MNNSLLYIAIQYTLIVFINPLHHSGVRTGCDVLRTWSYVNIPLYIHMPYMEQQCATAQKNKWCTHQASNSGQQQRCIHCPAKMEYVHLCTPPRWKHPQTWKSVKRAAKALRHNSSVRNEIDNQLIGVAYFILWSNITFTLIFQDKLKVTTL